MSFSRKSWFGGLLAGALLLSAPVTSATAATHPAPAKKAHSPAKAKAKPKPIPPGPAAFSIQPYPRTASGYFTLNMRPGQTSHGSVKITNTGGTKAKGLFYGADATTSETTGAVYLLFHQLPHNSATWVHPSISSFTLAPGQSIIVPFTVTVPANAGSGQRLTGLVADLPVAQIRKNTAKGALFKTIIQTQSIDAIQINLGSPYVCGLQLTSATPAIYANNYQALYLGIFNSSNVFLTGTGNITILTSSGRKLFSQPFKLRLLVNDTQIQNPQVLKNKGLKSLTLGGYKAHVTANFNGIGCHKSTSADFSFAVTPAVYYGTHGAPLHAPKKLPWELIGLGILGLILLFLLLLFFWRRRAPHPDEVPIITVSANDFSTFLTTDGKWKGGKIKYFTYQWQRSVEDAAALAAAAAVAADGADTADDETTYEDIPDAEANTYTVGAADGDKRLRVRVTAHGVRKSEASQTSEPTNLITPPGSAQGTDEPPLPPDADSSPPAADSTPPQGVDSSPPAGVDSSAHEHGTLSLFDHS